MTEISITDPQWQARAGFDLLARLDATATRVEIPFADGNMVWRHWGSGRPLVLLHGGGGSWTHWVRNIDALAATRSVWVPDLPGFGESALPSGETDADALTAIVERSARHAFGSEPCDMVGFSFGGMVAGFIAAEFPERIRRLILVGAPGMGLSSESAVALVSWRKLTDPAERDAAHRRNLRALMLHHDVSVDAFSLSLQMNNTARDRHRGRKLAFTDALAKALKQVRCPVHGIWGQEDVLYRSRHAQLRTVFTSPDFRGLAFIPDAGHWVQYERAGAFNEMLLGLLAED